MQIQMENKNPVHKVRKERGKRYTRAPTRPELLRHICSWIWSCPCVGTVGFLFFSGHVPPPAVAGERRQTGRQYSYVNLFVTRTNTQQPRTC
jgi:hypothetical protein